MAKEKSKQLEKVNLDKVVTVVKELPPAKKMSKIPLYDEIFNKIVASNEKIHRINNEELKKSTKKIYVPFFSRTKTYNKNPDRKFNLELRVRGGVIYIVKTDKKD